jgi:hypothetical protein
LNISGFDFFAIYCVARLQGKDGNAVVAITASNRQQPADFQVSWYKVVMKIMIACHAVRGHAALVRLTQCLWYESGLFVENEIRASGIMDK